MHCFFKPSSRIKRGPIDQKVAGLRGRKNLQLRDASIRNTRAYFATVLPGYLGLSDRLDSNAHIVQTHILSLQF